MGWSLGLNEEENELCASLSVVSRHLTLLLPGLSTMMLWIFTQ